MRAALIVLVGSVRWAMYALVALQLAACATAVLTVKATTYGDQEHVIVRYRGQEPADELLWEVCQWRTRTLVQPTDRAFEADFDCDGGGPAKVTLFRAGHEIATATTARRPAIAGAEWR